MLLLWLGVIIDRTTLDAHRCMIFLFPYRRCSPSLMSAQGVVHLELFPFIIFSLSLSLNFHLFSLLLLFLPASSYLCTIPMPLPKLHSWYVSFRPHLDESMYPRHFLYNLGPRRAENNRSNIILLWDAWPSYIQRKFCCIEFFGSFSGPLKIKIIVSLWPLLEDQACPNSSFFLCTAMTTARGPEFTGKCSEPGCKSLSSSSHCWDQRRESAEGHFLFYCCPKVPQLWHL